MFMQIWAGEPVTFHGAYAQVAIMFTVLSVTVATVFGLIAKLRAA